MIGALPELWWAYVLVGLVCGTFSATFGVGSGILMVPTLVLLFAMPQKSAQGVCLAAVVPIALVGALRYRSNPAIDVNLVVVVAVAAGGVLGALIGASIAAWTPGLILRRLFAIIMIAVAVRMLLVRPGRPGQPPATTESVSSRSDGGEGHTASD